MIDYLPAPPDLEGRTIVSVLVDSESLVLVLDNGAVIETRDFTIVYPWP